MINFLNETLRHLFLTGLSQDLTEDSQISFELPDEEFRNQVKTLGKNVLNVCLVDVRENRSACAADAPRTTAGPGPQPALARRRIDCHYLISAWSPAIKSVEPTLDEHALLYDAMALLMQAESLAPHGIYGATPLPKTFPAVFRDATFPIVLLPTERFPKIGEFWSTARGVQWKPTIHLVVTLPVVRQSCAGGNGTSSARAAVCTLPFAPAL